jgi:hypothetical protein
MLQRPGFSGFPPASIRSRVALLHPPGAAGVARALADAWQAVLPSVVFARCAVGADGLSAGWPPFRPSVAVGLRGAESAAVRLGLDPRLPTCSGVLVAGAAVPHLGGLPQVLACPRHEGILAFVYDPGERVPWILRLVKIGAEGEGRARTSWKSTGLMISARSPIWV